MLIRTAKGLQWMNSAPETSAAVEQPPSGVQRLLTSSKDFLPWIIVLVQMCSWFGVKYLTSDRLQQQQMDDHIAITELGKEVRTVAKDQAAMAAKFDLYIALKGK